MQFLASPREIESTLTRLLHKCEQLRWAVAWASHAAPLFPLLKRYERKIQQLTIGIHFYQTHPDFIEAFLNHESVRFVMHPDGVFHPKLYLFESEGGQWDCVTGSPNFTHGAFTGNVEVAVHFSHFDVEASATHEKIESTLDSYSSKAKKLTNADLDAYRSIWMRQQRRLNPLSGSYEPPKKSKKPTKSPLDVPLFVARWPEYYQSVKEDTKHTIEGRLAVLEKASGLLSTHEHFNELSDGERKGIAGFGNTEELDWLWFGSMKGAGYFKQAINQNSKEISDALDEIPLTGEVTRTHFERYVGIFQTAFRNPATATASRLLAFKRPDYFVCLDSKNRRKLCKEFEISQNVELNDYWERVVERITDSNWWNSPKPAKSLEQRIWKCRAAFLDVRFYEPD
ncbi:MAG: phospholipase D family protein [Planctomycetia bacterium]|nr:phospholipase D family protein [Planctomycetia bacterium]